MRQAQSSIHVPAPRGFLHFEVSIISIGASDLTLAAVHRSQFAGKCAACASRNLLEGSSRIRRTPMPTAKTLYICEISITASDVSFAGVIVYQEKVAHGGHDAQQKASSFPARLDGLPYSAYDTVWTVHRKRRDSCEGRVMAVT